MPINSVETIALYGLSAAGEAAIRKGNLPDTNDQIMFG